MDLFLVLAIPERAAFLHPAVQCAERPNARFGQRAESALKRNRQAIETDLAALISSVSPARWPVSEVRTGSFEAARQLGVCLLHCVSNSLSELVKPTT